MTRVYSLVNNSVESLTHDCDRRGLSNSSDRQRSREPPRVPRSCDSCVSQRSRLARLFGTPYDCSKPTCIIGCNGHLYDLRACAPSSCERTTARYRLLALVAGLASWGDATRLDRRAQAGEREIALETPM